MTRQSARQAAAAPKDTLALLIDIADVANTYSQWLATDHPGLSKPWPFSVAIKAVFNSPES